MLCASSTAAGGVVVQVVLGDFAAQGIAVDSQRSGGAALIAAGVLEDAADKLLFELGHRFVEQNAALDHHSDQRFQLLFHVCALRSGAPPGSATRWFQSSAWPVMRR